VAALAAGAAFAQANFSKYEALGDSLTAGYSAGALTKFYQDYSYPELLAKQFGITSFQQPTISDPGIGSYGTVLELTALHVVNGSVVPVIGPTPGNSGQPINATLPTSYNNLGIPGANAGDLLTKTGDITKLLTGNIDPNTIMFDLVLRDAQHTAIQQAIGAAPTFVTVWAGNNDVLNAALTGVALEGVTLTPAAQFQQEYTTLLGALRQNLSTAAIVVGTVPDVTAIPFVSTIKPYLINPATGAHIPLLGGTPTAIVPLTEQDYVTLGASSLLAQGIGIPLEAGGTGLPLPEGSVDATGLHAGVILRARPARSAPRSWTSTRSSRTSLRTESWWAGSSWNRPSSPAGSSGTTGSTRSGWATRSSPTSGSRSSTAPTGRTCLWSTCARSSPARAP
jgi:lysophospholipase L1-like esterase